MGNKQDTANDLSRTNTTEATDNVLFYDGKCPICAREIDLLGRLKDDQLALVDVHQLSSESLKILDRTTADMLEILHYRTSENEWLTGLDATVAAWRHTRFGWLFQPLRWPLIKGIADRMYNWWAKRRYCKLDYV